MRKKLLLIIIIIFYQISCSDDTPEPTPEEFPENIVSKKFSFEEVDSSPSRELKIGLEDLFNIQIYDVQSDSPYAMVLADNLDKVSIDFKKGKKYEILVSYIKNGKKEVKKREDLGWFLPFLPSWSSDTPLNTVRYTNNEEFNYISNPSVSRESGLFETYVPVDRFFGHIKEFVPDGSTDAITVPMQRMVFGLTVTVTLEEVPEIQNATVTVHPSIINENSPRKFNIDLKDGKGVIEIPYLTLETNEGQKGDLRSILRNQYEEKLLLTIGTEQEPARFYKSETTVKRMMMHHINLTWSPHKNFSLILEEEPMTSEEIFLNLNPNDRINTLTLKTNTQQVIADGASMATLEVIALDELGNDIVDAEIELEVNGLPYQNQKFKTTEAGIFHVYARAGDKRSNEVQIEAKKNKKYEEVSLPVVFHIVHFGDGIGSNSNLSSNHIPRLIDHLNLGFSNNYGSQNPNAVDTGIRFRLAQYRPDGSLMKEPGINRIDATPYDVGSLPQMRMFSRPWPVDKKNGVAFVGTSYSGDKGHDKHLGKDEAYRMAQEHHWDMNQYLNVYIFPIQSDDNLLGYAYYPTLKSTHPLDGIPHSNEEVYYKLDQCVINTEAVLQEKYNVLIHEVGHNLGLKHPFSTDNCRTSDYCSDTYSYKQDLPGQPCYDNLGLNEHDNFMDYIGEENTFTYQQRERMRHVLNHAYFYSNLKHSLK